MKMREAIENVLKTDQNSTCIDLDEIGAEVGYQNIHDFDYTSFYNRLKGYFITRKLCTDTWVGIVAYFIDDEFVFITEQTARRSGIDFKFAELGSEDTVRDFLTSLELYGENPQNAYIDMDEEIGDTYKHDANYSIITSDAILDSTGEKIKLKMNHLSRNGFTTMKTIDGDEFEVLNSDLLERDKVVGTAESTGDTTRVFHVDEISFPYLTNGVS